MLRALEGDNPYLIFLDPNIRGINKGKGKGKGTEEVFYSSVSFCIFAGPTVAGIGLVVLSGLVAFVVTGLCFLGSLWLK